MNIPVETCEQLIWAKTIVITKRHCILYDVVLQQSETDLDDDVTITKVVESTLDEVEFLGRKSINLESDESQCEDNSNSDSEISL